MMLKIQLVQYHAKLADDQQYNKQELVNTVRHVCGCRESVGHGWEV